MKNIFKRKWRSMEVVGERIRSAEDKNTEYFELPDGLRLIFRDGKYVGWYVAEAK